MKKILTLVCGFAATCALLTATSCSKENSPKESNLLCFEVMHPGSTKATASAFEADDKISLFAVEYNGENQMPLQIGGNYLNNEALTYDGTKWTTARSLYWSANPCDFYAFYPYQPTINSIEDFNFTIHKNQDGEGYEASDLLYAFTPKVSKSESGVLLQFGHRRSKVIVKVLEGDKFEGDIPDDIVTHIYNTATSCKVNWAKGSVEKDPLSRKETITMKKISNEHFEAVVVPQNLEKKTPLIEITIGGIAYLLDYSLSCRAGYRHIINVTLNTSPDQEKIEISIDPGVDEWN